MIAKVRAALDGQPEDRAGDLVARQNARTILDAAPTVNYESGDPQGGVPCPVCHGVLVHAVDCPHRTADPWPDTEDAAAAHYAACNPEPGDPS